MLWVCGAMLLLATVVGAQRRVPLVRPTVAVTIALKAGGDSYQFTGQARCTHAPMAAIYGVVSEQWSVQQSEGSRSLHLTVWKPKNGSGEMFNVSVSSGAAGHRA
jgi:hypothetical protein